MDEDEIKELLEVQKNVVKAVLEEEDFYDLASKQAWKMFNSHKRVGFTDEQALAITCASVRSTK